MLALILKTLSVCALVTVFILLLTTRELALPLKKSHAKKQSAPSVLATHRKEPSDPSTIRLSSLETGIATASEALSVEKPPETTLAISEVKESIQVALSPRPPATSYVLMKEGTSDTDPTYLPKISPCKETMEYTIGTLDSHFGISEEELIAEITTASNLWGDTLGKQLFRYSKQGALTINLIYDERQARTNDVNNLALEIENSKRSAETIRASYEADILEYTSLAEILKKDITVFEEKNKSYTDKVALYNTQGGAPKDVYDSMTAEYAALREEGLVLEERRKDIILKENSINARVTRYNEFVVYINELINKSNVLGAKKFTEGRFIPSTKTIDIFQYNNKDKLRRVLAHELGHVIGVNHNDNSRSIMYAINQATGTDLTKEDKDALLAVCGDAKQ